MNNNRKEIIISEICYWKENKLLPSQYCDFLLALYTEGDNTINKDMPRKKKMSSNFGYMALLNAIILFLALSLYITELSIFLQTLLYVILVIVSLLSVWFSLKKTYLLHFPLVVLALTIFLLTVDSITTLVPNHFISLSFGVVLNCTLWLYLGKKFKLHYFTLSSVLGLLLLGYIYFK